MDFQKFIYKKLKKKEVRNLYIFCARLDSTESGVWVFLFCVFLFLFLFFFFFFFVTRNWRQRLLFIYYAWTVAENFDFSAIFSTLVGPVYCSRDPQTSLSSNIFIKNESHNTIHTFKNYFATVFLVSAKIS